jgi:HAD superfamily hydrolase (TIGR01459 family)
MNTAAAAIPVLSSVASLSEKYQAWLCDIWGVMHNGMHPFAAACDACARFREQGGVVVLLSNSPRPQGAVSHQLAQIGVPETSYDAIVTSGDVTQQILVDRSGQSFFHLGPGRDKAIFDGLGMQPVELDEADYVLCSGLYDDLSETPADYTDLLQDLRAREMPMLCANPDIQVERDDRLIYCAGALAAEYEKLGGEVLYTGKPHLPIYERALDRISDIKGACIPRSKILCIGDGLKTDIAGAVAAGMDSLFVASALHVQDAGEDGDLDPAVVAELFSAATVLPLAALKKLQW